MTSDEDIDSAYTSNETSSNDSDDHVKVCVRIRPLLKDEVLKNNDMLAWTWEENSVKHANLSATSRGIDDSHLSSIYSFDYLFKPEHSNEYVFDSVVANIAEQAMCGFHGSGLFKLLLKTNDLRTLKSFQCFINSICLWTKWFR